MSTLLNLQEFEGNRADILQSHLLACLNAKSNGTNEIIIKTLLNNWLWRVINPFDKVVTDLTSYKITLKCKNELDENIWCKYGMATALTWDLWTFYKININLKQFNVVELGKWLFGYFNK